MTKITELQTPPRIHQNKKVFMYHTITSSPLISLYALQSQTTLFPQSGLHRLTVHQAACVFGKRAISSLQSSLWHPARALQEPGDPWREAPQGKCPQWGPGVNNIYESLLAQCSLRAVDALPPLLLEGDSICPLPEAVSILAIFYLHPSFLSFLLHKALQYAALHAA